MARISKTTILAMLALTVLILGQLSSAAPLGYDYDNLRDLYEILLRSEGFAPTGTRFAHQMERKGGRTPALRLRFGRRADPSWTPQHTSLSEEGPTSS